jgi:V8-like Glu-specific endopeptidase
MLTTPFARRSLGLATVAVLACTSALIPSAASAKAKPKAHAAQEAGLISAAPEVSKEAMAAGRLKYGKAVTPDLAISAYWTPERMKEARSVDSAPFLEEAYKKYEALDADRQQQAQIAEKRGVKPPEQGPELTVAPDTKSEIAAGKPAASAAAFNPNLNYWQSTAYTNGKVFFNMGGGSFSCSAAIVNSEGRDTVWTAGHCVHGGSGGGWASNWQFVPAYDDDLANPAPYGTWTSNQLWTRTAWTNNSDFSEDMGVAIMNPRNGNHIVSYFGGHGFRANIGKNVFENAMGYPAESPFDGGNLMRCWGTSSPEWSFLFWSSETIKIPCDMTRGSSGGPWLNGYNGNWGYLNGVNSRIDRIVGPTIMLSPYFDDTALSLYNATRWL